MRRLLILLTVVALPAAGQEIRSWSAVEKQVRETNEALYGDPAPWAFYYHCHYAWDGRGFGAGSGGVSAVFGRSVRARGSVQDIWERSIERKGRSFDGRLTSFGCNRHPELSALKEEIERCFLLRDCSVIAWHPDLQREPIFNGAPGSRVGAGSHAAFQAPW